MGPEAFGERFGFGDVVLNLFDQTNTIAYSWQEQARLDPGSGRVIRSFLAVPTRLTPRTLNVRVRLDF